MHSENGVLVDYAEIHRLLDDADVFVVRFGNFTERLLVDSRYNDQEMPLVQIVEPASGPRERLRKLMRRRPSLGEPRAFSAFPWPHSPGLLESSGVWDMIRRKVQADADPAVETQCQVAFSQLENLDRQAGYTAIKGDNYLTLWPREEDGD